MANSLSVTKRDETGSLRMKRMRQLGQIPAVLYGGDGGNVLLTIASTELSKIIQSGSREVSLTGSVSEQAFIKKVQWDTFGSEVLHVDLIRQA